MRSEFLHVTTRTHVFETSRDIILRVNFLPLARSGTRELKVDIFKAGYQV